MIGSTEKLRKQTHELVEARNEAVKANNARAEFLAHISVEIRTPLTGILGVAETLGTTPLDPYQQDQVNVILQSARAGAFDSERIGAAAATERQPH